MADASVTDRHAWWRDTFQPATHALPRPVDVLIAAVIGVNQVAGTIGYSQGEPSGSDFDAFAYLLLLAGPIALLFRRRWPEATVAATFLAAAGYAAGEYPPGPSGFLALAFAVVTAIMLGRRTFAWTALAIAVPTFIWLRLALIIPEDAEQLRRIGTATANLAWLLLTGAASEVARMRVERRIEQKRAAHEEARLRASEERLLIARELHDVLAHNISLINVQSGVALHLLEERPEQARPALEAINEASNEALRELRSVLDVLHRGPTDELPVGSGAPHAPTAGVRDLGDLITRTRAAGLDVDFAVEGEEWTPPAGIDLAVFRIAQEALTNVIRHAGRDARARVCLAYGPAELVVQVDDTGGGAAEPSAEGRGIAGMRERVRALGGTFTAGPRQGRGFRVQARFPRGDESR